MMSVNNMASEFSGYTGVEVPCPTLPPTPAPTPAPTPPPTPAPTPTPTPAPTSADCQRSVCDASAKPWHKKCNWPSCQGCAECAATPAGPAATPAPSPAPTAAPTPAPEPEPEPTLAPTSVATCDRPFCEGHAKPWDKKCKWPRCGGCAECETSPVAPAP